ncbi:MAG: hypothetical protein M1812_006211 [Candelaria pacifica]|nr:MAG: hypothetical protein M1812_006211 [Candelaria pacifica]
MCVLISLLLLALLFWVPVFAPTDWNPGNPYQEISPNELSDAWCTNEYGNPDPSDCEEVARGLHPAIDLLDHEREEDYAIINDYYETEYEFFTPGAPFRFPGAPKISLPFARTVGFTYLNEIAFGQRSRRGGNMWRRSGTSEVYLALYAPDSRIGRLIAQRVANGESPLTWIQDHPLVEIPGPQALPAEQEPIPIIPIRRAPIFAGILTFLGNLPPQQVSMYATILASLGTNFNSPSNSTSTNNPLDPNNNNNPLDPNNNASCIPVIMTNETTTLYYGTSEILTHNTIDWCTPEAYSLYQAIVNADLFIEPLWPSNKIVNDKERDPRCKTYPMKDEITEVYYGSFEATRNGTVEWCWFGSEGAKDGNETMD